MGKLGKYKNLYLIFVIFIIVISTIGSTYAYLTSTARSGEDATTASTGYNISMRITPIYNGFSMIPMDDSDVMKALKNSCKDKYNRGVCHAYNINVYDYDLGVSAISGSMIVNLDNINNLSYMMFEESDNYNEDNCINIDNKNYCLSQDANKIIADTSLSLGNNYEVIGKDNKNILLVIWLSNLDESQNEFDIGSYNATVTMSLGGNGGEVMGSINGMVNNKLQSEE